MYTEHGTSIAKKRHRISFKQLQSFNHLPKPLHINGTSNSSGFRPWNEWTTLPWEGSALTHGCAENFGLGSWWFRPSKPWSCDTNHVNYETYKWESITIRIDFGHAYLHIAYLYIYTVLYNIRNLPDMNTELEAGHEPLRRSELSRYFGRWHVGTFMIHGKVNCLVILAF